MKKPSIISGSPGLYRGLRRLDIIGLTLNNVIGAGIFALPAALVAASGNLSLIVLLVAFLLVALMALCTVEVASRYDVTGGPMHYATVAFGAPTGFVVGWLFYLSRIASFGAVATILLDYAGGVWAPLASPSTRVVIITVVIGVLTVFNLRGVVHGALLSNLLTLAKGLPLVLLALAGVWLSGWQATPSAAPQSFAQLSQGLLIAFFACMGFEHAAIVSGEVRHPQRDLPAGILAGVAGVGLLYILLLFACFAMVPDLAQSKRPLAEAAAFLLGPFGATAMSLTAVLSCAGNLSVAMLVAPRMLYALAAQGDLPQMFARVEPVRLIPAVTIITTAAFVWLLTVSGTFVYLSTFSVIARMLMYASTCVALITLRRRDGAAPVSIKWGPVWAVLAVLTCLAVFATTTGVAVRDVLIVVGAGWIARLIWRRSKA